LLELTRTMLPLRRNDSERSKRHAYPCYVRTRYALVGSEMDGFRYFIIYDDIINGTEIL